MPPAPEPETLGAGRYALLEPLGSGGVSTVFRARDHEAGVDCAVKLLLSHGATNTRARTRFVQEAHATAWLHHPNVVQVRDIGDGPAPYFYVMELASGSLAQHVRELGPCEPIEALDFAFQLLRALAHAHASGVVHRDVKPHNMLLTGTPGRRVLKLGDFGIARFPDGSGPPLTRPGDALGTLAYMAPEQRSDPRCADPRSDLYGVGATLYHLLTRRRPFDLMLADTDDHVLARLPEPIRPLVRRAAATRPADRHPSARAMAEAVVEARQAFAPSAPGMDAFEPPRDGLTPTPLPPGPWATRG